MILTVFNWNVVIGIGVTLVAYLLFLLIFSLVKKYVHKKRFLKEKKKREGASGVTVETSKVTDNGNKTESKIK